MKNKVALIIFLFFLICNKNYSQITMDLNQLTGINNNNLVGDTIKLETQTYRAFKKMESAAKNDGINLKIVSAYRGYDRQKIIWNKKYERFTNEFSFEPKKAILEIIRFSTIPGTSRHHWGTEIDIVDADYPDEKDVLKSEKFEKNGIYHKLKNWLDKNSEKFGFYLTYNNDSDRKGFEYEPWHYSYKPSSLKYYNALIDADLKKIINNPDLKGHQYFTESFINKYISENIMDINPDLK